jgi:cytochrome P450
MLRKEVDDVLQGRDPTFEDVTKLPFLRLCLAETLRMYPQPPLLIRRALEDDLLPQGGSTNKTFIPRGTDIFIATWNMHRSPDFWENPNQYDPLRFTRNFSNPSQKEWAGYVPGGSKQSYPNEVNSDFAFIPFGAGVRKCVGDQFAIMESAATLALLIQRFDVEATNLDVGMRTGMPLLHHLFFHFLIQLMMHT